MHGGETKIDVRLATESSWPTTDQMVEKFQRNKSIISRHIKDIYERGKLEQDGTVAFFATVQNVGERRVESNIKYYNFAPVFAHGRGRFFRILL